LDSSFLEGYHPESQVGSGFFLRPTFGTAMDTFPDIAELISKVCDGDRVALGRAITLVESASEKHKPARRALIEGCLPRSSNSIRVGITGVPGVGKSTFIESLGNKLCDRGHRVAVLAVDPSGAKSGGSILGDKTRMEKLATREEAFIRPSASRLTLGGVARKTRESIILCEAAGYDVILVETVGVGQSETAVYGMVDFFLLLLLPGAGDELQGIKRGIMEMAHAVVINKADGDNRDRAREAYRQVAAAVHLLRPVDRDWTTRVLTCSGLTGEGCEAVWQAIEEHQRAAVLSGQRDEKRKEQDLRWFRETLDEMLRAHFQSHPAVARGLSELEKAIASKSSSPWHAAEALIKAYLTEK
jgi:LAO/AO transport system kinase